MALDLIVLNKTAAILFLLAVAILFSGVWMYFGKIQGTGLITNPTGTVTAVVVSAVDIFLQQNTVNFGTVGLGATFDTTGNYSNASRFLVRNDGSVAVNITMGAGYLWNSTCSYTGNYEYNVTNATGNTSMPINCQGGVTTTQNTWNNMPISGPFGACSVSPTTTVMCRLNFSEGNDYAKVDVRITVPTGEAAGGKSSVVTFTASQA